MTTRFEPLDVEGLERMAHEGYARKYAAPPGSPLGARSVNRPRNVRATLFMVDGERVEIPYRGRVYELLPVSFEDGLRLADVRGTLEELEDAKPTTENVARYRSALRFVVALAPRYLRPRGRWRRAFWALTRNPFRHATDAEVGELLGFFLGSRMRSRVRHPVT